MEREFMVVCHINKGGQSAFTRFFVRHIGAVTRETIVGWEDVCKEVGGYDNAVVLHWQELYTNGTGHMATDKDR